ncbi:hypothetical protein LSH36_236g02001 [Paralvinella palmiformis]|uniref:C2H2-type domain-containing protein n=1 Tax=Paralvinella palmiformis TaxID=53620 RepID=A0AAD9JN87_9ANNE|nr:hypothetical protein LSH36_236g02001 [Paralvinella palmiformis]
MSEKVDVSLLNPPVILGKSDVIQILHSFKDGTEEVRNALMYECKVILECKICSSLFRGLPNFLAHKRKYCQEHVSKEKQLAGCSRTDFQTVFITPPVESVVTQQPKFYDEVKTRIDERQLLKKEARVQLLRIDENMNAVYQNISNNEYVKVTPKSDPNTRNPSVANKIDSETKKVEEVSLQNDSIKEDPSQCKINSKRMHELYRKIMGRYHFCDLKHLNCKKCNVTYQSFKSLKRHMLAKHITGLKQYTCSKCGSMFQKVYNMKRHLLQAHKMSWREIERSYEKKQDSFRSCTVNPLQLMQNASGTEITDSVKAVVKIKSEKVTTDCVVKVTDFKSDWNGLEKENVHRASSSNDSYTDRVQQTGSNKGKERKNLTLFRCSFCNKAFGKKITYDSHVENCSKANFKLVTKEPGHGHDLDEATSIGNDCNMQVVTIVNDSHLVIKETDKERNGDVQGDTTNKNGLGNGEEVAPINTGSMEKFKQNLYKMRFSSHQSLSEEYMNQLRKITDEGKHKCLRCGMKFCSNSALHLHAVRHMGWKRFKCKLCGYKGFNRSDIKTHLRRSHPARTAGLEDFNKFIVSICNQNNNTHSLTVDVSHSADMTTLMKNTKESSSPQTSGRSLSKTSPPSRDSSSSSSSSSRKSSPNTASSGSSRFTVASTNYNISTRRNQRVFDLRPCRSLKYSTSSQEKK